jgi:hypothetical protein
VFDNKEKEGDHRKIQVIAAHLWMVIIT